MILWAHYLLDVKRTKNKETDSEVESFYKKMNWETEIDLHSLSIREPKKIDEITCVNEKARKPQSDAFESN